MTMGFHIQRPVDGWTRTLGRLPAGTWIKAVDGVQWLDEAKRINPGLKTILRHWYDGGQVFGTTDQTTLRQRARRFFSTFIDGTFEQYAHNVNAIEEWNEYNATSHTGQELAERVAWADAVSWVWKYEYRTIPKLAHIRLVLGSVAIGNDLPWQYAKFAAERDCILGYHPYVPVRDKQTMADEWQYYSGRWAVMDAAFVARGYRCQWLFTEAGPVGYNPPASLNALDGWRHPNVCNGDVNSYLAVIDYWLNRTAAWNKANGNRALGAVLFTTGGGEQWRDFETRQPEIDAITAYMEKWAGSVAPPDPPGPPPPTDPRRYSRTVHLLPQDIAIDKLYDVMMAAHEKRQSITWSADDAVINPDTEQAILTARNVIVWGTPPGGSRAAFEAWVEAHYAPLPAIKYKSL